MLCIDRREGSALRLSEPRRLHGQTGVGLVLHFKLGPRYGGAPKYSPTYRTIGVITAQAMQPTSSLTEAAEKAAALLQTLQSRLRGEVPVSAEPEPKPAETQPAETKDELDRQLQEYFGAKEQASVLS